MEPLEQEVRRFLQKHHIRLNTNLGQHFLIDQEILNVIVDSAGIEEEDHIVEVGPGIGVLTRELLKRAGRVTSIEIDERLLPLLQDFTTPTETPFEILHSNALQVEFPKTPYKIVANIPYHITSPLLRHAFLESKTPPQSLTLLMQREVAEKIVDTENTGILTILVALFGVPTMLGVVSPNAFLPPPEVDSAILHIESHKKPLADAKTIDKVLSFVKIAFSGKRKMLRNTIGRFQGGMELLSAASVAADRRPQTLSVQEWITLAKKVK
ncbi:ribosomal RNA small subunit methyltransferase A [Candidatus Peribacteria bacterium RIFCSPHIGHO2_02_FULL_52_16]|nr:MAG: ribosomal RNA small subunit methyltransferase A [Candidatus Peribacteria bacterium RIFCSPHIGHO2_01_FULL_51_35]OGJ61811.1 MAG: ribosomal RNA small subunit methyltransferase A [Candidatus Peribacteria bacterium RIFCSPHIGHO2_02_FULL_52_16]